MQRKSSKCTTNFISRHCKTAKLSIKCKYFLKASTVEIQDKIQELLLTLKKLIQAINYCNIYFGIQHYFSLC